MNKLTDKQVTTDTTRAQAPIQWESMHGSGPNKNLLVASSVARIPTKILLKEI